MWSCWRERVTRTTRFSRTRLCLGTIEKWRKRSCAREDLKRLDGPRPSAVRPVRHRFGNRLAGSRTRTVGAGSDPGVNPAGAARSEARNRLLCGRTLWKEEPSGPVSTKRILGYAPKANLLRHLCGGRLHRWLTFWRRGRVPDSIPWPGWPASQLILARYVPANCSWPSTDRVTTDTIILLRPSEPAPWQLWWPRKKWVAIRTRFKRSASSWATPSWRSSSSHAQCGKPGAGKLPGLPVRSARPRPKRSWRRCWARGSAY